MVVTTIKTPTSQLLFSSSQSISRLSPFQACKTVLSCPYNNSSIKRRHGTNGGVKCMADESAASKVEMKSNKRSGYEIQTLTGWLLEQEQGEDQKKLDVVSNEKSSISTMSSKLHSSAQSPQKASISTSQEKTKKVTWIDKYLPEKARPYAHLSRIDKPIGSWLLVWPALWAVAMVAEPGNLPNLKLLAMFGWWAVLIRGAGCTINDLFDRDFDKKVERTKSRPLASGALTPAEGLLWLVVQLFLGLIVLYEMNNLTLVLGVIHVPLVFAYPLMKRLTYWPQAFLGVMISWGAFLGSTAVKGSLDHAVIHPLYISSFFWTLVYDTIYAHQDKEDDAKARIKSTALRFGDSTKEWITGFGIPCILALALSGFNANIGMSYYMFLAIAACQLTWQIWTVDLSSPVDCGKKFVSNQWFGAIIFIGIIFGKLFQ